MIDFYFGGADVKSFIDDQKVSWFQASQICKILEFSNTTSAIQSHTDEDERMQIEPSPGFFVTFINEFGVWGLILGSKKPKAKEFKWWLKHEVLPKLRKASRGGYIMPTATSEQLGGLLKEANDGLRPALNRGERYDY